MIDAGKVVPIIDLARGPGLLPMIDAGKLLPAQRLPSCRPCRSTAGNVVPIIQGHGWQRPPSCPWCRSTPGSWCRSSAWPARSGPVADDRRREAGAESCPCRSTPGTSCRSSRATARNGRGRARGARRADRQPGTSCRPCRSTAGKLLPIIQGHGWQRPRSCPWCPSCRSTTGNVVPAVPIDSREAVADHPGPRVATAAVVPVVPAVPIIDLAAVLPYGGKLLPIIDLAARSGPVADDRRREAGAESCPCRSSRATARNGARGARRADRQPGRWCRSSTWLRGARRAGRVDHRPCRGPALRREAGARGARADRRREGGAAPRQPGTSCRSSRATARNGARGARRADRQPGRWCRSSTWLRGARRAGRADHRPCRGPALRREAVADHRPGSRCPSCRPCRSSTLPRSCPTAGSWCPWCPCRSTAGKVVPIIDLAARSGPVADDRRREAGAESCPCRSSRATARNGARGARRADRQPGRWCRSSTWLRGARRAGRVDHRPCRGPALRREAGARGARADRRREGGAAPRQPGTSCRSSRATAGNGRGGVRRAGRAGRVDRRRERRADHRRRERRADHPGPRLATAAVLLPIIDGGNVVPVVPVPIDSREAVADHPGPRVATAAVVPVVPAVPIIDLAAVLPYGGKLLPIIDLAARSCCRSSTAGNVVPALATAAVLLPIIDGGNVVPVVPVPIDAGNVVPIIQGHGWQRPRSCRPCRSSTLPRSCPTAGSWCPWCRSTPGSCCRSSRATARNGRGGARGAGRASTAGKLLPIIQGHGSQRPRWCPSCRSTPGSCCRSSTWLRGPGLLPMIDAGKLLPALATVAVVPAVPIDSREGRADHPGPRLATAAVVPVVPIDAGKLVPIIGLARGPGLLPMIDGGKLVPSRARADRRRERRADHPGPRLATAAVVPVVPVVPIDNRERRAGRADRQPGSCCRSSRATGGNGRGRARGARRADRQPGTSCRPCRSTAGKLLPIIQGHGWQRPRWCPSCRPCRSSTLPRSCPTAGSCCRSSTWLRGPGRLPMIDGGKLVPSRARADHPGPRLATVPVVPVVPIDSREGGADHRPGSAVPVVPAVSIIDLAAVLPYGGKLVPVVPVPIDGGKVVPRLDSRERRADHPGPRLATVPWCPSCRSTAGKVVPIIDLAARCPSCRPCRSSTLPRSCPTAGSCCRSSTWLRGARRAGRVDHRPCRGPALRREAGARGARADRQPGRWCRSSTWLRGPGLLPMIDGGKLVPSRARADHPGPRLATVPVVPVVPIDSREGGADHRPGCAVPVVPAVSIIDLAAVLPYGGKLVPVVPVPIDGGKVVPRLDSRERRADHPGPRLATAAVVSVVPAVPAVSIDGGNVVPIIDGGNVVPIIQGRGLQRPRSCCRSSTAGTSCPWCPCRSTAGKLLPIIQGHGWQRPRSCPSCRPCRSSTLPRSCPTAGSCCRSSTWLRGPVADHRQPGTSCRRCNGRGPVADHRRRERRARGARADRRRERRADHPGPRVATAAVVPAVSIIDLAAVVPYGGKLVPVVPIDAGKLLPIIQGHGSQRPRWCPSCRSTPGSCCRSSTWLRGPGLLPMIDAGKLLPASQRLPSCRPCRSTAGNVVPIIQGHGWQRPPSCPWCRSTPGSWCRSSAWLRGPGLLPMIDGGKVVPRLDSRERRADHPGPRVATAAVVPVVPAVPAVSIDGGNVVPIIQGRGLQRPRSCCRSSTAGNVVPALATAAVLLPIIDGGNVVPVVPVPIDSREAVADHPGPRVATAAVVPVVPAVPIIDLAAVLPYGGKLLPIIDLAAQSGPVADDRRREAGAESCPCRSSRATARNGARGARRADRQPGRWCRSSTSSVLPVAEIDGGKLVPVVPAVPIDSRERRADHPGPRLATAAVLLPMIDAGKVVPHSTTGKLVPVVPVPIDGGNVVPIIQGHGSQRCPWCPSCRSTAGSWCRSSTWLRGPALCRSTAGRWCPSCPWCRSTPGTSCPWCPCRSTPGSWCRSSAWLRGPGLLPMIDGGKLVPSRARADRRRERRADHPGPRLATAAVVPVVPVVPIDNRERRAGRADRQPGSCCRSSRATGGNGRGPLPMIDAGKLLPIIQGHGPRLATAAVVPVVPIDAGNVVPLDSRECRADHRPGARCRAGATAAVVPVVPSRADHRPCRGPALRREAVADHRPGCAVRAGCR